MLWTSRRAQYTILFSMNLLKAAMETRMLGAHGHSTTIIGLRRQLLVCARYARGKEAWEHVYIYIYINFICVVCLAPRLAEAGKISSHRRGEAGNIYIYITWTRGKQGRLGKEPAFGMRQICAGN